MSFFAAPTSLPPFVVQPPLSRCRVVRGVLLVLGRRLSGYKIVKIVLVVPPSLFQSWSVLILQVITLLLYLLYLDVSQLSTITRVRRSIDWSKALSLSFSLCISTVFGILSQFDNFNLESITTDLHCLS